MAIHELDELTPRTQMRALSQDSMVGLAIADYLDDAPLAGDAEETRVTIDIPTKSGGHVVCECVVLHNGEDVVDVRLPAHFRDYATAAGVPSDANCWEGYLETLARVEFARQSLHLTCRKCGRARGAAVNSLCDRAELHDWMVGR